MFASALKAAGSAAAGLMSGTAALPFTTESEYTSFAGKSPWRMYKGKKDVPDPKGGSNKVECTIFVHDLKGASPAQSSAARNAMKKLRTIKHPYLVKCLDAGEINDQKGGGTIYIVTEPVQPLSEVLSELQQTPASIVWGVYTLAAAVNFLNIDCKIVHGQVSIEAIFVDRGMDWKLGGFELSGPAKKSCRTASNRASKAFIAMEAAQRQQAMANGQQKPRQFEMDRDVRVEDAELAQARYDSNVSGLDKMFDQAMAMKNKKL